MILCFDIGNTHTKIGLFAGDQLRNHWRIATVRDRLRDEYAVILLDLFAALPEGERAPVRERLLELFGLVGDTDARVIRARGRLSSLLF